MIYLYYILYIPLMLTYKLSIISNIFSRNTKK